MAKMWKILLSFDTYRSNDAAEALRASQPDASPTRLE